MLHDPATLRGDVWYKGKTTTSLTPVKMEYKDEMKMNLQDLVGISLVTLQCDVMPTWLTLLWISIYHILIRLPRDTWSLHTNDATTTGCALPPLAWNGAWMTLGAYFEDNEELRSWIQVCQYKETGSLLYGTDTHKFGWRSRRLLRCRSLAVGWRPKDSKLYE
jgi:hypothetical protein